jgi:transcription antitermination protein NusB
MSRARSAARLAAVQALYQHEMDGTPVAPLLHQFHQHRLGATVDDKTLVEAEVVFFDDVVAGTAARMEEIDRHISANLGEGWSLGRLDRPLRQILRAGSYELIARPDIPVGSIISEYLDVADAFYGKKERSFVNGVLDAVARVRKKR